MIVYGGLWVGMFVLIGELLFCFGFRGCEDFGGGYYVFFVFELGF